MHRLNGSAHRYRGYNTAVYFARPGYSAVQYPIRHMWQVANDIGHRCNKELILDTFIY